LTWIFIKFVLSNVGRGNLTERSVTTAHSQSAAAAAAAAVQQTGLHFNSDTSADGPWLDDSETRS